MYLTAYNFPLSLRQVIFIPFYSRYRTRLRYEQRSRSSIRTAYECCTGYRQQGNECPIGKSYYFRNYQQKEWNIFMSNYILLNQNIESVANKIWKMGKKKKEGTTLSNFVTYYVKV